MLVVKTMVGSKGVAVQGDGGIEIDLGKGRNLFINDKTPAKDVESFLRGYFG